MRSLILFQVVIILGVLWGWGLNIIKLAALDWGLLGVEAVLRIVGVIVVPLGAIMGFFV